MLQFFRYLGWSLRAAWRREFNDEQEPGTVRMVIKSHDRSHKT